MKRYFKILTLFLIICVAVYMLSACSIIGNMDGNHNDDGQIDNNSNNDDKNNSNNSNTVNGLPEITLTEGMSWDEVKNALADVTNYTYTLTQEDTVSYFWLSDNGFLRVVYYKNNIYGKAAHVYENDLYYTLLTIDNRYQYKVEQENNENQIDKEDLMLNVAIESLENAHGFSYEINNGQLIITTEDYEEHGENYGSKYTGGKYVFYNFNNTIVNVEEYFPDYKSLEIGEYEGIIGEGTIEENIE